MAVIDLLKISHKALGLLLQSARRAEFPECLGMALDIGEVDLLGAVIKTVDFLVQ